MEKIKTIARNNKKWIISGVILILIASVSAVAVLSQSIPVEVEAVSEGEVSRIIKGSGIVESSNTITIMAKNNFSVESIYVKEGQTVDSGDVLILNEKGSIALDIKSMRSQLAALQAQYNDMKNNTQLEIRSMEAQLTGLKVQYKQARDLADKNKLLFEAGAVSFQNYNETETAAALLSEQVSSMTYSIKSIEASSDTASKQLAEQIKAQEYAIQSFSEVNGKPYITAPISGTITAVYAKIGENIFAGSPLFEISDMDNIYTKVNLIAQDAGSVNTGDRVWVYNEDIGLSDANCKVRKIEAKAHEIMSELGINQKRVAVEIEFRSTPKILLGIDVDVEITVDNKENVLRIPKSAVFDKDKKNHVFLVENGKATMSEVTIGLKGEEYYEVVSGIAEGALVIVSPGSEIEDDIRVKVVSN